MLSCFHHHSHHLECITTFHTPEQAAEKGYLSNGAIVLVFLICYCLLVLMCLSAPALRHIMPQCTCAKAYYTSVHLCQGIMVVHVICLSWIFFYHLRKEVIME